MKYNINDLWTGLLGTSLAGLGASLSLDEIQTIVSIVVTVLGAVMTFIVMPLINWYKESKKDGKITKEEIEDGVKIVVDGSKQVKDEIDKASKK